MRIGVLRALVRQFCVFAPSAAIATFVLASLAPSYTESAVANGDTRTIHLYHTHSFETIDATFRVNGHYDPAVLAQLNHFLRDWRNNDEHVMDPRLFDAVWEAYRTAGATDRIHIYSAYRSPETNAMLRRRSRAVAEHSQHMLGKAMDTTMPGFPMSRIREAGMKLQHGGVGWYPSANFVHLDVGGVRSWPRMPYEQLARIFPDGKTVHISADGRTMPGYEQARLELGQRGDINELPPAQESSGFFAWLFGGGGGGGAAREDEEDRRAPTPAAAPVVVASAPQARPEPTQTAPQTAMAFSANTQMPEPASVVARPAPPPVQPTAPQAQQMASLEPAIEKPSAFDGALPLPPRRPTDLAEETPDIPLPPIRPDALDRIQTASIRYDETRAPASPSGVTGLRRSLPPLITHGAQRHPAQALAFASAEALEPRNVPLPIARPTSFPKPLALRSARKTAVDPTQTGPQLTGLRRAAQLMAAKEAL